jgi:hypothetical protein
MLPLGDFTVAPVMLLMPSIMHSKPAKALFTVVLIIL